jgi:ABC-type polysaccharide/polyol phosphate transport system ATPase subunit
MTKKPIISLKNVGVFYYTFNQGVNSSKDFILKLGFTKIFQKKKVVEGINLDIFPGEVVGILGKNGTGKSSLLRCMAGILKSHTGQVIVNGKIAPMLSIGAGIEMELTGLENIKFISSLMGTSKKDLPSKIEEIKAFSELDLATLKRPVKTYSTGMISRLSFSIAISEIPDILLIDEVLAVGDVGFQQKCLNRINEIKALGCTILFVSHSEEDIRKICTRAICIDQHKVIADGSIEDVLKTYQKLFNA